MGPLCTTLKWKVGALSSMPSTTLAGDRGKEEGEPEQEE